MPVELSWDPRKARANIRKHGVSFEEAGTVFEDAHALTYSDEVHPERSIIIGQSGRSQHRLLLCVHVEIDEEHVRIVSARLTTPRERRRYAEGW